MNFGSNLRVLKGSKFEDLGFASTEMETIDCTWEGFTGFENGFTFDPRNGPRNAEVSQAKAGVGSQQNITESLCFQNASEQQSNTATAFLARFLLGFNLSHRIKNSVQHVSSFRKD